MPRNIPIALQSALASSHQTWCYLMRIDPIRAEYAPYGVTSLDVDVTYDDGISELTYVAAVGMVPTTLISTADNAVNEQEARSLIPEFDIPVSDEDLRAGVYDTAEVNVYRVDYTNLAAGHVHIFRGTLGRVMFTDQGLSFIQELRPLAQNLKQSITEKWSIGCRATFGSQPLGSNGGGGGGGGGVVHWGGDFFTHNMDRWNLSGGSWSPTDGRTTPGCFRVDGTGAGTARSDPYEIDGEGVPFTVWVWARPLAEAVGDWAKIGIEWYDADDNLLLSEDSGNVDLAGLDWVQLSASSSSPVGTASARILITLNAQGQAVVADDLWLTYTVDGGGGGGGGSPHVTERFPCRYNAAPLWEPGTVATVGLESNQSFTTSGLTPAFGGNPGKVRWLTGRNAGRENEVDQFDDGGGVITIGLTFPTMFPIEAGDTFDFRDDCPKTKAACKTRGNWPHFRGEPNIPVADAGQAAVPGASAGIGTGGHLSVSVPEDIA